MNKIFFTFIFLFFILNAEAQTLNNKLNIYFRWGHHKPLGSENVNDIDNYITPSLFANYHEGKNISIRGTYNIFSFLSIGLQYDNSRFSSWNYNPDSGIRLFYNSTLSLSSSDFIIQIHSPYKELGLLNEMKFFAEFSPSVGTASLELAEPVFDIIDSYESVFSSPLESDDFIYGTKISVGTEFKISSSFGVLLSGGYGLYKVDSKLYNDKDFRYNTFNIGFYVMLIKDKHFYY